MKWYQWLILLLIVINGSLLMIYVSRSMPNDYIACQAPGVIYLDGHGGMECIPRDYIEKGL